MIFEKTYGNYLKMEAAIEYFYDDICDELDANLVDYDESYEDGYTSKSTFTNGDTYSVEIYFDENDEEWKGLAKKL